MAKVLGTLFRVMPFLFGIGFLAPLIAQVLERTGAPASLPFPPVVIGLTVGGLWGAFATWKGRWI